MRPNLSVEKIAGALAVLGTGVLMAACGGPDKPANAPVNSTETPAAGADAKPADGSCGAHKPGEGSCGAHKAGEGNCGAKPADKAAETKPADATPAAATPAAAPDTKAADSKAADAKADPKKADAKKPATTDAKKPAAAPDPKKKAGGASCGAGTCSAKK